MKPIEAKLGNIDKMKPMMPDKSTLARLVYFDYLYNKFPPLEEGMYGPSIPELTKRDRSRLQGFLNYVKLPQEGDSIGAIILPSTSEEIDPISFYMRNATTIKYATNYLDIPIFISGQRPAKERASLQELQENHVEANDTKNAILAIAPSINPERFRIEGKSTNLMENITKTMPMVIEEKLNKVIFIESLWSARRLDFYVKKYLRDNDIRNFTYYIYDQDVINEMQFDKLTPEEQEIHRIRERIAFYYELTRLGGYRKGENPSL